MSVRKLYGEQFSKKGSANFRVPDAVQLSLPLQVDARAANNWDEAH